jgi:hypothetical protein
MNMNIKFSLMALTIPLADSVGAAGWTIYSRWTTDKLSTTNGTDF